MLKNRLEINERKVTETKEISIHTQPLQKTVINQYLAQPVCTPGAA